MRAEIESMGGTIVGVTAQDPHVIPERWAGRHPLGAVAYPYIQDVGNEMARGLRVAIGTTYPSARKSEYPWDMAQPALFVFSKRGEALFEWRHRPSMGENMGGAVQRVKPADVIQVLKGEKRASEVELDPQLGVIRLMMRPTPAEGGASPQLFSETSRRRMSGWVDSTKYFERHERMPAEGRSKL